MDFFGQIHFRSFYGVNQSILLKCKFEAIFPNCAKMVVLILAKFFKKLTKYGRILHFKRMRSNIAILR